MRMLKPRFPFILTLLITLAAAPVVWSKDAKQQQTPAYRPSAEAMILDGLIYRPLYLVSAIVGTGVFIATLPFSLPGGNAKQAGETLIVDPAKATFSRCLGCFPDPYEDPDYR